VACLAFGFSWLTAIALRHVSSHHAGIVIGGIPLATAFFVGGRAVAERYVKEHPEVSALVMDSAAQARQGATSGSGSDHGRFSDASRPAQRFCQGK